MLKNLAARVIVGQIHIFYFKLKMLLWFYTNQENTWFSQNYTAAFSLDKIETRTSLL